MWPFFALWDFWFWSFFGIFIIFEFVWANKSNWFAGILTPFGFLIWLFLFSSFNPFSWIAENFSNLWIYCLGYVAVGLVWSFFHWFRFVAKAADFFSEFLDTFRRSEKLRDDWFPKDRDNSIGRTKENKSNDFWDSLKDHWVNMFGYKGWDSSQESVNKLIPQAMEYKQELVSWMALWPFDMVWMVLSDLLIEVWNWLFARFRAAYQAISNRAFRKYTKMQTIILSAPSSNNKGSTDEVE